MPHQIDGIKFLMDHPRAILADEAGLGKSRQVLEAAKNYIKNRNLLVICPTSVIENWKEECRKWAFPEEKFVVIGYEYGFLHKLKDLKFRKWGVIVADEAHMLRNWSAQRTKNFRELLKGRDSRVWLLSGTPIVKGAHDLHSLLSFVEPGVHGKYKDFCEIFCKTKPNQWKPSGFEFYGVKNNRELNTILNRVMIRRLKSEELPNLPPKITSKIPLKMPQGNFDIFTNDGIIRKVIKLTENGGGLVDEEVAETLLQLGLKKVDYVIKFIEDTLLPKPLVIFGHHRLVLYDIAEKLRDKGRKVQVILGGMSKEVRQQYIYEFQEGKLDDLVCSIGVAGVGINLFRSSYCVFAEFPWTWAALDQASDRLHRIGQKECVNVYWCYAKGTFEEAQLRTIESRKTMTSEVIGI